MRNVATKARIVGQTPAWDAALAARDRFFRECIVRRADARLSGSSIWLAYIQWCRPQRIPPLTQHRFGRRPPWEKQRVGGRIYYMGAALADLPSVAPPHRLQSGTASHVGPGTYFWRACARSRLWAAPQQLIWLCIRAGLSPLRSDRRRDSRPRRHGRRHGP